MADVNIGNLNAFTRKDVLPTVNNQCFRSNPLMRVFKEKKKTYSGKQIGVTLEYGDQMQNVSFPGRTGNLPSSNVDILDEAQYDPHTMTGTITIPLDDILDQGSDDGKLVDIVTTYFKNMVKTMDKRASRRVWERATTDATKEWYSLQDLVSNGTSLGGINGSTHAWWNSPELDLSSGFDFDATSEEDLLNPASDVYILKIYQRALAKASRLTDEYPDFSQGGQYIFDLIESILDPQKTGNKMNEKMGSWGFTNLEYRGCTLTANENAVEAQVDSDGNRYSAGATTDLDEDGNVIPASSAGDIVDINADGRLYFLNMEYMYLYMNKKATFSLDPGGWRYTDGRNSLFTKIHARGNFGMSNRAAHCVVKGFNSPYNHSR